MTVEWVIGVIAATVLAFYGLKAVYAKAFADGWKECARRRHCPHNNVAGIYGDAINHTPGFRRNRCMDCGGTLDGPVSPRGAGVR